MQLGNQHTSNYDKFPQIY